MPQDSYRQPADSANPVLIIYLLDISLSMNESDIGGQRRIDVVRTAFLDVLKTMLRRSIKGTSSPVVASRYRMAVFAYNENVYDVLQGVRSIKEINEQALKDKDKAFKFIPSGNTDTKKAFEAAKRVLSKELPTLQDNPAPLICHMTDAEYNVGGDPSSVVREIMSMSTKDGSVLVQNIFVSPGLLKQPVIDIHTWPGIDKNDLADNPEFKPYAEKLYGMSSPLPQSYAEQVNGNEKQYCLDPGRPMMFPGENSDLIKLAFTVSGNTPVLG